MDLKQKIQYDLKEAQLKKDELSVSVLRMLIAAINNKEIEKWTKLSKTEPQDKLAELGKLSEEEVNEVVFCQAKKNKESILEFEKGNRQDLVEKERKELQVLEQYLPKQLSEEEIRQIVKEAVVKVGAQSQKDMSKVMGELMPKVKGKADGSLVNKIVKELLF